MLGLDTEFEGQVRVRAGERIQYIPQLPQNDQHQLPISVREYLAIGVYGSFLRLGAVDFERALEHVGVAKEKLHQSFLTLSGGERQRVAIARALLANPTILVLDEPLAAVDYASRDGLYALIRHLQQDHRMTVMLVSHDVDSVLPLSDWVLCLNQRLHTDCHPTEFTAHGASITTGVHHHC
jgi:zinc transport system ATP-binding protein